MNKRNLFQLVAAATAIVATGLLFLSSGKSAKDFQVSANFPLTGEIGIFGENIRDSVLMALEDIERNQTEGPKLSIDWGDNAGSAKNTVTVFQKQLLDSPDVYISGFTPQTLAIKEQIDAKSIPHIAWMFSPKINNGTDNNFRTWVSYKIEVPMYVEYVKRHSPKKVAIVHVNLPYPAEEFDSYVIPQMKEIGVSDIMKEVYDISTKDYNTVANKVKQFQPDLIILNGFGFTLTGLVKSLRILDLIDDDNTIATYDMIDAQSTLTEGELEGIRVVAPKFVTHPDLISDWSARFETKYGRPPLFHNAYAYDMTYVIHSAARRLELSATSDEWISALKATKLKGITGNLSFDSEGDLETELDIGVFRSGKLIPDPMQ